MEAYGTKLSGSNCQGSLCASSKLSISLCVCMCVCARAVVDPTSPSPLVLKLKTGFCVVVLWGWNKQVGVMLSSLAFYHCLTSKLGFNLTSIQWTPSTLGTS